ncbi:MAG: metallophosphoesterase family protein [Desulfobacterales bacterium]|jgi:hypothetical protein|nr:metallophosphoesterase family protein [Desulfobacterales bacterium]
MIFIGMADLHGRLPQEKHLNSIFNKADFVFLVGDITNFGREAEAQTIVSPLIERFQNIFAVSGNCDFPEVDAYLNEKKINLHGRCERIEGIGFIGLGGSLVTPFGTPNEYTDDEIVRILDTGLGDIPHGTPLVLVSHQPPFQTSCDRISSGAHVGSLAVRKFIEIHQPLVCLTGHIHESSGIDKIGKTHIINPGQLGRGGYAYVDVREENTIVEIRRWQ